MPRIAVSGAAGRMGRRILALALLEPQVELAAALEAPGHPALGQPVSELVAGEVPDDLAGLDVQVADVLSQEARVDVAIDFSAPAQSVKLAELAVERGFALLVGTTGHDAKQKAAIAAAAGKVALIHAPNCSVGVNVCFQIVAEVAKLLGKGYDIEIVESHHRYKVDAPSGTALRLAERIAEVLDRDLEEVVTHGRRGMTGERSPDQIGIHALRRGDLAGEHTVYFTTLGETVELTHRAHSRDAFAMGAIRAARWLAGKPPGKYTMDAVLGL